MKSIACARSALTCAQCGWAQPATRGLHTASAHHVAVGHRGAAVHLYTPVLFLSERRTAPGIDCFQDTTVTMPKSFTTIPHVFFGP